MCISRATFGISVALCIGMTFPATAASRAQLAYDACAKYYDGAYSMLANSKAMVVGIKGNRAECFWSYGRASVAAAINGAGRLCLKSNARCVVFHDSNGYRKWSARIAANGGKDAAGLSRIAGLGADTADLFGNLLDIINGINEVESTIQENQGSIGYGGGPTVSCPPGYYRFTRGYGGSTTCVPYAQGSGQPRTYRPSTIQMR